MIYYAQTEHSPLELRKPPQVQKFANANFNSVVVVVVVVVVVRRPVLKRTIKNEFASSTHSSRCQITGLLCFYAEKRQRSTTFY